jgi:hypothetical protein
MVKFEKYFTTKGTKFFHKAHKKTFVTFVCFFFCGLCGKIDHCRGFGNSLFWFHTEPAKRQRAQRFATASLRTLREILKPGQYRGFDGL